MIKLEGYKILKKLGSGGMGDVYLAEHEVLETRVAIKSLNPNLVNDENFKKRFRTEAKVHAKLNHSNIVKLIDFQERKNGLYIVMEYVEGKQLDDYIINESGPIPEKELLPLFCQILDAISHAHSKGLVHRDIKPANIIINEGKIKVLDFGIAKDSSTDSGLTKTGLQVGTPMFMSPEQVNGEKINTLTDIYSLGVTLFYMAVGKPPYENTNSIKLGIQVLTEDFPNPKDFYPWVSDKLSAVINKATKKKKSDRYQSCDDFKNNLESKDETINKTETAETNKKGKNKAIIIASVILLISSFGFILFNQYSPKEVVAEETKFQTLYVKDKKAYFYSTANESSKLSSYVILNDKLNCGLDTISGFINCTFTNDENLKTSGFIKTRKLKKEESDVVIKKNIQEKVKNDTYSLKIPLPTHIELYKNEFNREPNYGEYINVNSSYFTDEVLYSRITEVLNTPSHKRYGKLNEGLAYCDKVIANDPNSIVLSHRSKIKYFLADYHGALEDINNLLEFNQSKDDIDDYWFDIITNLDDRAKIYFMLKRYSDAINDIQIVIDYYLKDDYFSKISLYDAYLFKGETFNANNNFKEACLQFQNIIESYEGLTEKQLNDIFQYGNEYSVNIARSYINKFCNYFKPDIKIGDYVGGGIVFHIESKKNYALVCDISDIGITDFGFEGNYVPNLTSTEIGAGQPNTNNLFESIVKPYYDEYLDKTYQSYENRPKAVDLCKNSSAQGFNDWFLPSKDEINQLYLFNKMLERKSIVNGFEPMSKNYYWSSSLSGKNGVWMQSFLDSDNNKYIDSEGYQGPRAKHHIYCVRAIRILPIK
tara:strand:- start:231 stop:2696 length:2466 start_codon:yes stop_codon:yes gene_type:complete